MDFWGRCGSISKLEHIANTEMRKRMGGEGNIVDSIDHRKTVIIRLF